VSRSARIAEAARTLHLLGYGCALVGGHAVSIRTRERFTNDIDLAVATSDDDDSGELAFSMQRRGYVLTTVLEQEEVGVVATLRFLDTGSPVGDLRVDLLCASCGIEPEIVAAATAERLPTGVRVRVASTPHLIAMKTLAVREGREQDAADLRALLAVASKDELAEAREALRLITERGFTRGKRLEDELGRFL
jgi:predicted nucleotidyltransferase